MAVAEHLTVFASKTLKDRQTTFSPVQKKAGGVKLFGSNSNRSGGDRKPYPQLAHKVVQIRTSPRRTSRGRRRRPMDASYATARIDIGTVQRSTFNDNASPIKSMEPQASTSGRNDSEEDEDNLGAISQWCNTLSHHLAAKKTVPPRAGKTAPALTGSHPEEEEAQLRYPWKKGLMFVDVKIHGNPIRAMIDTGGTHNYLTSTEIERLGLVLEKGVGRVKAINSAAQPIDGVAKSVLIKVGPFEGKTNLSIIVMDDFKLILGVEFLRDTRTVVFLHVDSLMMWGPDLVLSPH
ncbi:UNVERIFIED_CONTAM: hypothetical protein Sradi_6988900 [Sesamum radiatum]|uniref:Uncharacterized protein n=1 Tax=Sesamum radiatum TaxID=300843 RepID=A0AAW2JFW1_SESRA